MIWSLANGTYQPLANLGKVGRLSFSQDGKTLATTSWDKIQLFEATTWKLRTILEGHIGDIGGIALLPDGHSLVSCGSDRTVRLWQWPADDPGNATNRVIGAHLDGAVCLAVTHDGSTLATGASDGTVRLWNIANHDASEDSQAKVEFRFGDGDKLHSVWSVLPLPDRKRVLIINNDGAEFRDLTSGRELSDWPAAAGRGALSPDGQSLAVCNPKDGSLKLWDVATKQLIATAKTEHVKSKYNAPVLAFSPDGRTLASGWVADSGGAGHPLIQLWDVAASLKAIRSIHTTAASIDALSFSPDGKTLAASPGGGAILLFDGATGQARGRITTADWGLIVSVAFTPDSRTLAAGREGGVVCLWDPRTGELLKAFKGHASTVAAIAFSPDGGTLATGGEDATVRLWDVETGQERVTLKSLDSKGIHALAFPDANTLAAVSENGWVCIRHGIHNPAADVASVTVEESGHSGLQ
jgi:WD40 repeat protein